MKAALALVAVAGGLLGSTRASPWADVGELSRTLVQTPSTCASAGTDCDCSEEYDVAVAGSQITLTPTVFAVSAAENTSSCSCFDGTGEVNVVRVTGTFGNGARFSALLDANSDMAVLNISYGYYQTCTGTYDLGGGVGVIIGVALAVIVLIAGVAMAFVQARASERVEPSSQQVGEVRPHAPDLASKARRESDDRAAQAGADYAAATAPAVASASSAAQPGQEEEPWNNLDHLPHDKQMAIAEELRARATTEGVAHGHIEGTRDGQSPKGEVRSKSVWVQSRVPPR